MVEALQDFALKLPGEHRPSARCSRVLLSNTITNMAKNPHFLLLFDKAPGQEYYYRFLCTCGSTVRCGVPCRHFWAVLRDSGLATFHSGMCNDLWFREPQSVEPGTVRLHTFSDPNCPIIQLPFQRPPCVRAFASSATAQDLAEDADVVQKMSHKRLYGSLLGEAKKAIEHAIATGREVNLHGFLTGFCNASTAQSCPRQGAPGASAKSAPQGLAILNPPVVNGKGRQKGSLRKGARHPLRPVQLGVDVDAGLSQQTTAGQKRRRCGNSWCGEFGHDRRNCPQRPTGGQATGGGSPDLEMLEPTIVMTCPPAIVQTPDSVVQYSTVHLYYGSAAACVLTAVVTCHSLELSHQLHETN